MRTRIANPADIPAIVPIVNAAFAVEKFFINGERTSDDKVREQMNQGVFIIAEDEVDNAEKIIGSVYVERHGSHGYFGMLAVAPEAQGRGLGRLLVEAAEQHCRACGCTHMDLSVINLRTELPPFYRKLGYHETHTSPLPDRIPTTQPAHFIHMSKPL